MNRISSSAQGTEAARKTALRAYIDAHRQYMEMRGGEMVPLPSVREVKIGNVTIPPEVARHIGRWSIPIPVDPAGFKRPEERW